MDPSFYDSEFKAYVAKLPTEDRDGLLESLFNNMVNIMGMYYRELGHSDREVGMHIKTEVESVKKLIRQRVEQFPSEPVGKPMVDPVSGDVVNADDLDPGQAPEPKNPCVPPVPMDDQFNNDCMIDLGLILSEFGVRE